MNEHNATLPKFLWLWLPMLFIVAQGFIEILVPSEYLDPVHSEGGPHETFQFLIALLSIPLAARLALTAPNHFLKLWFFAALAGTVYIAGEEVSWGQHIFGWTTPEFWSGVNDQNETNLHNTSSWLDQKPRLLLYIGIVVTGIIVPALRKWKPGFIEGRLPSYLLVLLPSGLLLPTALGVLVPHVADEFVEIFHKHIFRRVSEIQEIYIYYFIFLYLLDFRKRVFSKV
jgi:hypothetical protein